jgi:hypothetical protein
MSQSPEELNEAVVLHALLVRDLALALDGNEFRYPYVKSSARSTGLGLLTAVANKRRYIVDNNATVIRFLKKNHPRLYAQLGRPY